MGSPELIGYPDPFAAAPGETISFFVGTDFQQYEASLVRLTHGDRNPDGPGLREIDVASSFEGSYPGQRQMTRPGSFLRVDLPPGERTASLTAVAWIYPTTPIAGVEQGLLSRWTTSGRAGYGLYISESGRLAFRVSIAGDVHEARLEGPLEPEAWYLVAGVHDARGGRLTAYQRCCETRVRPSSTASVRMATVDTPPGERDEAIGPLVIGAVEACPDDRGAATGGYNGKIERPALLGEAKDADWLSGLLDAAPPRFAGELIAQWDLNSFDGVSVRDLGPNGHHARASNMPAGAVAGHRWDGSEHDPRHAPEHYGALHFHADDLSDVRWDESFAWEVPTDLSSGIYAARLRSADREDRIPLVVRPPRDGASQADVVVLLPTLTYWAYANERSLSPAALEQWRRAPADWRPEPDPRDQYLAEHPEYGKSLYDRHDDGSGCCFSSRLRPIPNLRPDYRCAVTGAARHLGGDLYLISWLEAKQVDYDVITDEDLHRDGLAAASAYRVLLTGSHPEYATEQMLDALDQYVDRGGRMMYLGGNGFYWVTAIGGERNEAVEVRRGYAGSRQWESGPGECHHALTGELGGLWRHRGRPPNRLVGVGTTAFGHDGRSRPYRRANGHERRADFVFDGLDSAEPIGAFGLSMNGAAGDEIDRADPARGTPETTVVLATADGFSDSYQITIEDQLQTTAETGGSQHRDVRADMVLLGRGAGAVFSVGSICWSASLPLDSHDNDVSLVTWNVLQRFLDPSPLDLLGQGPACDG